MSDFSDNTLDINKDNEQIFAQDSADLGKNIKPVPKPASDINIDVDDAFFQSLINSGDSNPVDITEIENFATLSRSRETLYDCLDTMAQDSVVAAALETYAEDATETNDKGEIVWCESENPQTAKYVTFLLNSLGVNKNIYRWIYSLIKYGDIYLRLYRESDFQDNLLSNDQKTPLNEKYNAIESIPYNTYSDVDKLDEAVKIKAHRKDDKLVNYIDIVPNPAEMFELTKFGKTYCYIKTNSIPHNVVQNNNSPTRMNNLSQYYLYKLRRNEVEIYNAVSFVHGSLQDDVPRIPEQVQIFNDNMDGKDLELFTYNVKSGQSILYNTYKIWRERMLLNNALLLNRITKSSILRVLEVEVGDMSKGKVREKLQRVKTLVEQKSALDVGNMMSEYVNPGAMENTIYVPVHNGIGSINTQQVGGEVNVKDIADIDYFNNMFYGSLKIPKQFFGETDDAAGFNGGTSLSILSSRYAKTVRRIQTAMLQTLTDAINILLIDRGLDSYVNNFQLQMQAPVTQEELDKRDAQASEIQITDDVMRMLDELDDPILKLKALKAMLSQAISNQEVIELIQEKIEQLENTDQDEMTDFPEDLDDDLDNIDLDFGASDLDNDLGNFNAPLDNDTFDDHQNNDEIIEPEPNIERASGEVLPSPAELSAGDFTSM